MIWFLLPITLVAIWKILSHIGARIVFRPQQKCWPFQLPFVPIHDKQLTGAYLAAQTGKPTLVFFHGRGGNISHFESFARAYAPLGYGILMTDYRGFGLSKGVPSQKHLEEDAITTLNYALNTLKITPQNIILFGHSLGNAAALAVAHHFQNIPLKALILQSPFLSTPDMAASWAVHAFTPKAPFYKLIRIAVTPFLWSNRFDNTRLTQHLNLPVLVCMSKKDQTLPWQQSAKLADGIFNVQRFLSPTGGHDDFEWAVRATDQFIRSL